jgi:hypothetical protein
LTAQSRGADPAPANLHHLSLINQAKEIGALA